MAQGGGDGTSDHDIACAIAELMGDPCACDLYGIDEWLPQYCDFAETDCPNVPGVTCWEQYLKYLPNKPKEEEA